jgi:hypothetical protein
MTVMKCTRLSGGASALQRAPPNLWLLYSCCPSSKTAQSICAYYNTNWCKRLHSSLAAINFTPAQYTGMGDRKSHHAHFAVLFLLVCNAAGHAAYFNRPAWDTFVTALEAHARARDTDDDTRRLFTRLRCARTAPPVVRMNKLFKRVQPELPRVDPVPDNNNASPAEFPGALAATGRSLKWEGVPIHFTDGSAKNGAAGAAVVLMRENKSMKVLKNIRLTGKQFSLGAELVGIAQALRSDASSSVLRVATDCAVAMALIRKGLLDPSCLRGEAEERKVRSSCLAKGAHCSHSPHESKGHWNHGQRRS